MIFSLFHESESINSVTCSGLLYAAFLRETISQQTSWYSEVCHLPDYLLCCSLSDTCSSVDVDDFIANEIPNNRHKEHSFE